MLNEIFARRFKELEAKFAALRFVPNGSGRSGTNVPTGEWMQWATSAQSLIRTVYGEDDPHCQNFDAAYKSCNGYRVIEVYAIEPTLPHGADDFARSPLTLAVFGLLAGYYISYAVGLVRWRFGVLRAKRQREALQRDA